MSEFYRQYFMMALEAGGVLIAVLMIRPLLKRFPKRLTLFLWMAVLFRLICPVAISRPALVFPSGMTVLQRDAEYAAEADSGSARQVQMIADGYAGEAKNRKNAEPESAAKEGGFVQEVSEENVSGNVAWNPAVLEDAADAFEELEAGSYDGASGQYMNGDDRNGQDRNRKNLGINSMTAEFTSKLVSRLSSLFREAVAAVRAAGGWLDTGAGKLALDFAGGIWLLGAFGLGLFGIIRYWRLSAYLREAVFLGKWQGCTVRCSRHPDAPMSFGMLRPCIYVPAEWEEQMGDGCKEAALSADSRMELILRHEAAHIKHGDLILKTAAYLALCIHWWNPLVWLMMRYLGRDIEMACDESVLNAEGEKNRKQYAQTLLQYAVKRSNIEFSTTFGENSTEGRIRNIMSYRKITLRRMLLLGLAVLLMGGCLATRPDRKEMTFGEQGTENDPADVSKETMEKAGEETSDEERLYGAEGITEDGYYIFESMDAMHSGWEEMISSELMPEEVWENGGWHAIVYFPMWKLRDGEEPEEGKHYTLEVDRTMIRENGETSIYSAKAVCYSMDGKIYSEKPVEIEGVAITSLEQAVEFEGVFDWQYGSREPEHLFGIPVTFTVAGGHWSHGSAKDQNGFEVILNGLRESDPQKYQKLKDPVTALETLMHLEGGSGIFYQEELGRGYVFYTFADGSVAHYRMKKIREGWCPESLDERENGYNAQVNEDTKDAGAHYADIVRTEETLRNLTAGELRRITARAEENQDLSENEDVWVILDEHREEDSCLYAVGENAMALRIGERVIPIPVIWKNVYGIRPDFFSGDFDGDGKKEYAIRTHSKNGGSISGNTLYMVETDMVTGELPLEDAYVVAGADGREAVIYEFSAQDRLLRLKDLRFYYDREESELTVKVPYSEENGVTGLNDFKKKIKMPPEDDICEMLVGNFEAVALENGTWYYEASCSGTTKTGELTSSSKVYAEIRCALEYDEAQGFTLGEIEVK